MWTGNYKYHPSWWRDWEFEHTGVDRPSRIFDQNFGPGSATTRIERRVHTPRQFHMPRHFPSHFPSRHFGDPYWGEWDFAGAGASGTSDQKTEKEAVQKTAGSEAAAPPPSQEPIGPKPEELPPVERGMSEVISDKEKYQVTLDVAQFDPEEITVKTVDQYLVVECKHEERADEHGFISRSFTRKYILPKEVDPVTVESSLSPEGTLMVRAPKQQGDKPAERKIRIDMAPPMK